MYIDYWKSVNSQLLSCGKLGSQKKHRDLYTLDNLGPIG